MKCCIYIAVYISTNYKESNLNINFLYVNDMQCNKYVLVTVLECLLFTLAGVAVDTVPHHCGCWLWPRSEQCFQTVETNIDIH